jgi:hypothetical protein
LDLRIKRAIRFVLASNDDRIGDILAIAEGSLEEADENFLEVLNANLDDYIDAIILEYDSITDKEIEAAIEKAVQENGEAARALATHWTGVVPPGDWQLTKVESNFSVQKSPLLLTLWGQGSKGTSPTDYAYNNYVKHAKNAVMPTGCGPVAMAQIIAYHNYINPAAPNKPAAFTNHSQMGTWTGTYNLAALRTQAKITNNSDKNVKGQVAVLMWQVGQLANATHTTNGTSVGMDGVKQAFDKSGYAFDIINNATILSETATKSSIYHGGSLSRVKDALNNNRPILATGFLTTGVVGHAWVIDGYGSMTYYREYFKNSQTGKTGYATMTVTDSLMVHCNMGWDGAANGWYI